MVRCGVTASRRPTSRQPHRRARRCSGTPAVPGLAHEADRAASRPGPRRNYPPSGFADKAALHVSPERDAARRQALQRGMLVHRLMQSLPDIPAERRRATALRYLARAGKDFSTAEHEAMVEQVLAVLAEPRFAALFAPGSRAEIAIAGRVGARAVSGQVDRLSVAPDAVLIADYKTNRPAPQTLGGCAARLHPAACALPGGARRALPGAAGPRRAGVDRHACLDGDSCNVAGRGSGMPHRNVTVP